MMKKGCRKGYFYTIDAVIGIIVLLIGLFIIAGIYFKAPDKDRTQAIANDITGLLANVKVNDLCSDFSACECRYSNLSYACSEGLVTEGDLSLMDTIGLLYYKKRFRLIEGLINETIIDQEVLPTLTHDMQIILQDPKEGNRLRQVYPVVT
jgi:hypothetical protein